MTVGTGDNRNVGLDKSSRLHFLLMWLADYAEPSMGFSEAFTMTTTFSLMVIHLLSQGVQLIVFPLSTTLSVINSLSTWIKLYKEKHENGAFNGGTIAKASVYTFISLLSATTVIISFFIASISFYVAPLIFTIGSALKTLFNLGNAVWYAARAYSAIDPDKRREYRLKATGFALGSFVGVIMTITVGFMLLAAKSTFALVGIVGGAMGIVCAIKGIYDCHQERCHPKPQQLDENSQTDEPDPAKSSLAKIYSHVDDTDVIDKSTQTDEKEEDDQLVDQVIKPKVALPPSAFSNRLFKPCSLSCETEKHSQSVVRRIKV